MSLANPAEIDAVRLTITEPWRLEPHRTAEYASEGRWKAWRHLKYISQRIARAVGRGRARIIICMPPGHGKALKLDTPIPTPTGWSAIGELKVGDSVFDDLGQTCKVIRKSEVWKNRPVFAVRTDDGDEIIADSEHQWRVRLCGKREVYHIHNTARLAKKRSKRAMVKPCCPLILPEAELLIDPYILGVWLGDGCKSSGLITQSKEDIGWLKGEFNKRGYFTSKLNRQTVFTAFGLKAQLKKLGLLKNKHIPARYMRASISQRMALLQGLIDTDGHVTKDGQVEFCQIKRSLAEQVRELVHSLGRKASLIRGRAKIKGRDCGVKYRVMFYMTGAARMPRKAERCRDNQRTPNRYISAGPCGNCDTVCIEVDSPSHMFLCGRSMLPTHNSHLGSFWTPTWFLNDFPERKVITASHGAELASSFARMVRNEFESNTLLSTRLSQDSSAADRWNTPQGGGMVAIGVGGGITGWRSNLTIVDDAHPTWQAAWSITERTRVIEWFDGTLYDRSEPDGSIIILGHRWHEDDLPGHLISNHSDSWEVIKLPALAELGDLLGRQPGEALWPERFSSEVLLSMKPAVGDLVWSAKYQQNPRGVGSGRVYDRYEPDIHEDKTLELRYDLPLDITFDFNRNPGMHVEIGQYDPKQDMFSVVYEIHGPMMKLAPALIATANKIKSFGKFRWPKLRIFGDATGTQDRAETTETCYQQIRSWLNAHGWPSEIRVPASNPPVIDRIDTFNEALRDSNGGVHFKVHQTNCPRLKADLKNLKADEQGLIDKRDQKLSHASDATAYWINQLRPLLKTELTSIRASSFVTM